MRLDPSGFADYYDYDGHVGNDGVDDGERYAVIPYQGYNRNKPDFDIIKNGGQSFKFPSDRMIYEIMCLLYNEAVKPGPIFEHTEAAGSIGIDLNSQSEYFIFGGINNNKPSNSRYLAEATKEIEYANSILKNLGFIHFYDVHTHPYSDDWFGESFLPSGRDGKEGDMAALAARDLEGSTAFALEAEIGSFAVGSYKCNKFVYDVLKQVGAIGFYRAGRLPTAGEYADFSYPITGLKSLGEINSNNIMLGDVIAGHTTTYGDATGHVEIVNRIYFETNIFSTTGAHDYSVYSSFKGWEIYNKSNGFDYFNIRRAK